MACHLLVTNTLSLTNVELLLTGPLSTKFGEAESKYTTFHHAFEIVVYKVSSILFRVPCVDHFGSETSMLQDNYLSPMGLLPDT